jgi:hypothetical protein
MMPFAAVPRPQYRRATALVDHGWAFRADLPVGRLLYWS